MITWISTKSPIRMLDKPIDPEVESYLRANHGIDSAILAADLGISRIHIESYQRRLGLRALANPRV
jgi:hypothetical protein